MNLRITLYETLARHRLDPERQQRLLALAEPQRPPTGLATHGPRALGLAAGALGGLGLVMWVAANWSTLSRAGRFGVLMAAVAALGAGASTLPRARAPLAMAALLAVGALFAYVGQTYQTGADAWQLFALWAVLALPLALGARADLVWAGWALVAMCAVALWTDTHAGLFGAANPARAGMHTAAGLFALALALALTPPFGPRLGAGPWSRRLAAVLAVAMVGLSGIEGLFDRQVAPQYALSLALVAAACAAWASARCFELFALSAAALALNTLLVAGLARVLFDRGGGGDPIGRMLLLGLVAAGSLAATVKAVLALARRRAAAAAETGA